MAILEDGQTLFDETKFVRETIMGTHLKNLEAVLSEHDIYTLSVQIVKPTPQFRGFIHLQGTEHLYDRDNGELGKFISAEYPDARRLKETIESGQR